MALPPRDHHISLADAAAHAKRHRDAKGSSVHALAFHADQVRALLAQPGCVALRVYHGRDAAGVPTLMLVGVDGSDEDLVAGGILEWAYPCPPFCAPSSALNA